MNQIARPMPRPTAQVLPYVEVLGADLAVTFLLQFGGAGITFSADPKGGGAVELLVGYDRAKALAAHSRLGLYHRVPLAKRWLAAMLQWQGQSIAGIARTLRTSDVSVSRWLADSKQGRLT